MRYLHWTNGPGKVWTRETIFVKKIFEKMSGFLRQWPLSLHRKTANYGSDFTNFENITKIKNKLFYQYSIGGQFMFNNFCCKMETVDFFFLFLRKIRQICQNVPKTAATKLKEP